MLISFVCTGNICRSPSAALVAKKQFAEAGLADVIIESAGTSSYHIGESAHHHVNAVLAQRGYDTTHSARPLGAPEKHADLVIVATSQHQRHVQEWGVMPERIKLLRSFDDYADSNELADPYYSGPEAFAEMLDHIEAAMPGIIRWAQEHGANTTAQ